MRALSRLPHFNFMGVRKAAALLSVFLLVGSVALLLIRGLNLGIDFSGGVLVEIGYDEPVLLEEIRGALDAAELGSATVQFFGTEREVLIRLAPEEGVEESAEISSQILRALEAVGHSPDMRRIEFVGAAVGDELAVDGALAALFALIGILIYVAFRFEWKFALGAIGATAHDAIIVLGWFALLGLEFDLTVLAAVLATIGYSLNDTIVVYDRVRENFLEMRRSEPLEVINAAVNQVLPRTIVTSGTTLFVLFSLFFFGGQVVHNFSIAMIAGVVIGTYSSVFIASTALLALGVKHEDLLPPEEKGADEMP